MITLELRLLKSWQYNSGSFLFLHCIFCFFSKTHTHTHIHIYIYIYTHTHTYISNNSFFLKYFSETVIANFSQTWEQHETNLQIGRGPKIYSQGQEFPFPQTNRRVVVAVVLVIIVVVCSFYPLSQQASAVGFRPQLNPHACLLTQFTEK